MVYGNLILNNSEQILVKVKKNIFNIDIFLYVYIMTRTQTDFK